MLRIMLLEMLSMALRLVTRWTVSHGINKAVIVVVINPLLSQDGPVASVGLRIGHSRITSTSGTTTPKL